MSSPKPKAPTPIVISGTGPFRHRRDVPATVVDQDPYATTPAVRQGQPIPTTKIRTQFKPEEFSRVINQHGYFVTWTKALRCPCNEVTTDQPDINCEECGGSGFYYTDPIPTRAIMTAMERNQRVYERFGAWVEGTSTCTVEPMYRLGYLDRIEMVDSVMPHSELFTKGNRRGIRSKLPANKDSLRYRISRATALIWRNPQTQRSQRLEEGFHFAVDKNGWIEWLFEGNELVEDGQIVSALYEYHPVYLVMSHPHAFRDGVLEKKNPSPTVVSLPIQAIVKLDYLADINTPLPSMCPCCLPGSTA